MESNELQEPGIVRADIRQRFSVRDRAKARLNIRAAKLPDIVEANVYGIASRISEIDIDGTYDAGAYLKAGLSFLTETANSPATDGVYLDFTEPGADQWHGDVHLGLAVDDGLVSAPVSITILANWDFSEYSYGNTALTGAGGLPYRSISGLAPNTGAVTPTLRATENDDSWYLFPAANFVTSGCGSVEFTVCGLASISFMAITDVDPTTVGGVAGNLTEYYLNGVLHGSTIPTGSADGEEETTPGTTAYNNSHKPYTIALTNWLNTIRIVGTMATDGAGGDPMQRVDVTEMVRAVGPGLHTGALIDITVDGVAQVTALPITPGAPVTGIATTLVYTFTLDPFVPINILKSATGNWTTDGNDTAPGTGTWYRFQRIEEVETVDGETEGSDEEYPPVTQTVVHYAVTRWIDGVLDDTFEWVSETLHSALAEDIFDFRVWSPVPDDEETPQTVVIEPVEPVPGTLDNPPAWFLPTFTITPDYDVVMTSFYMIPGLEAMALEMDASGDILFTYPDHTTPPIFTLSGFTLSITL